MKAPVQSAASGANEHVSMNRLGRTAVAVVSALLLSFPAAGCADGRNVVRTLPASTLSAVQTAEQGSQSFLIALSGGGVADEDISQLLTITTHTATELSALDGLTLIPAQDDVSTVPTSVPTASGVSAAATIPAGLLSLALTQDEAATLVGPTVTVDSRVAANVVNSHLEVPSDHGDTMTVMLRQAKVATRRQPAEASSAERVQPHAVRITPYDDAALRGGAKRLAGGVRAICATSIAHSAGTHSS